jgi:hypothetical protein
LCAKRERNCDMQVVLVGPINERFVAGSLCHTLDVIAKIRVSLLTGVMYKNESVWIVPGTVSADD